MLTKIEETANSTDSEEEKVSPSKKVQADQQKQHQKNPQQKKQGKSGKNAKKKDDWEAKIDQQFDTKVHKPDDKKEL